MSQVVHNPLDFLRNVSSSLKGCGDGTGTCTCTDPSFKYSRPCKLTKQSSDNSRCYFGEKAGDGQIIKSTSNYHFLPPDSVSRVNTTDKGKQPFTKPGGSQPLSSQYSQYPRSLLFCNTPDVGGRAYPNPSNPNIVFQGNQFTTWNDTPNVDKKQPNLGFE